MCSSSNDISREQQPPHGEATFQNISTSAERSVSFSSEVLVKRTLHCNNYSDDEIEATWFNDADFQRIRKEIEITVDLMESGEKIDESKYCSRGLESYTTTGADQKAQNRIRAADQVFDEQHLQWSKGLNNPDRLSEVYQAFSIGSSIAARMAGRMDEAMVRGRDARVGPRRYKKLYNSTVYQRRRLSQ